ncbi:MAG: hypothetical protein HY900_12850 [Deltaproteobacteria bacterium]|nr:hypothetical protein [Deltaproteobacteria bacterium]
MAEKPESEGASVKASTCPLELAALDPRGLVDEDKVVQFLQEIESEKKAKDVVFSLTGPIGDMF